MSFSKVIPHLYTKFGGDRSFCFEVSDGERKHDVQSMSMQNNIAIPSDQNFC